MSAFQLDVSELEDLAKEFAVAAAIAHDTLEEVSEAAGEWVAVEAARLAPVRTGHLAGSIRHIGKGRVVAEAEYAGFVEFGHREFAWGRPTGRMRPPRRYMGRALDTARKPYRQALATAAAGLVGDQAARKKLRNMGRQRGLMSTRFNLQQQLGRSMR